jgi:hypothetical protein
MSMLSLEALKKLGNEEILLRKIDTKKAEEYAEKMRAGVVFPSVKIGRWPKSEKYGETGIVDGLHRIYAANATGLKEIEAETIEFKSLPEALSYMYTANMAHGLPPTEGQRNARIVLLKKMDPTLTLDKIGQVFKLTKSSIDRILKGQQGEGQGGRKAGAIKSEAHKTLEPLKPKAFFAMLDKIVYTCERKRAVAEIVAFASPEGEEGVEIDQEKVALLGEVETYLKAIRQELK